MDFDPAAGDALIIVDPQNDFCPGGALAVQGGDEIMASINRLAEEFPLVVITQDWHPRDHKSFASNHAGGVPFSSVTMPYGPQVLWPDHCVQGSTGAAFHPEIEALAEKRAHLILRKGYNPQIDSYSAFYENDKRTSTGLSGYLREKNVGRCFFVGLAFDFCVAYSALDAVREGFEATVLKDLTRSIALPVEDGSGQTTADLAEANFRNAAVTVVEVTPEATACRRTPTHGAAAKVMH